VNIINKQKSSIRRALYFGVSVLMLCAAMPSAWADQHKPDPSQAVLVVAHVPFDGKALKDISIQTQANGNRYLYVEHSPEQGVSILDIGRPSQPTLVGSVAWPDAASTRIRGVSAEAMLLDANAVNPNSTPPANDPLVLWDTSKPDSPRVVQRFANVSRVLSDDRGYMYILNDDGLWVISTPTAYLQNQPSPFQTFWVCVEYTHEAPAPCTQGY
jgi:hypothetical protein